MPSLKGSLRNTLRRVRQWAVRRAFGPPGPADPAATATALAELSLSCVVLDMGAAPTLVEAVRSLLSQTPRPEVIVVSSSAGDAEGLLRDAGLDVPLVASSIRLMPGAARNVGLAASHGDVVAFLAADCLAEPGWVQGRLAAHGAGADVVASAVTQLDPSNPFSAAAHTLLFSTRLPNTPRSALLHYGCSYRRSVFDRFGRFDPHLRTGEDTELHARFDATVRRVFRGDVRTAHRNPDNLRDLFVDQFRRGRRGALARTSLTGDPGGPLVARNAITRVPRLASLTLAATPVTEWPGFALGAPWLVPAAVAYAAGALSAKPSTRVAPRPAHRLLCVIQCRNERAYFGDFLENVAPQVDGILVLDDGSTDGSADLWRGHPKVLEVMRRSARTPHEWDELGNRRLLVDAAGRHGAEWVLALDADERLERHFRQRAEPELAQADGRGVAALALHLRELWDSLNAYRVDGVWGEKCQARLFRYRADHDFGTMALHGGWAPRNSKTEGGYPLVDLNIYHLRMVRAADRERRKARYKHLDPDRRWQAIGYDYLTDTTGLTLAPLPEGRDFWPRSEGGVENLTMPGPDRVRVG